MPLASLEGAATPMSSSFGKNIIAMVVRLASSSPMPYLKTRKTRRQADQVDSPFIYVLCSPPGKMVVVPRCSALPMLTLLATRYGYLSALICLSPL